MRVLSRLFRGKFSRLEKAFAAGRLRFFNAQRHLQEPAAFRRYLAPLHASRLGRLRQAPFRRPAQVLKYLARYTHRVAISNNRLLSMDDGKVTFRWKDYATATATKTMTLDGDEFIRRFLMHVLPDGFHRIRYYGFLGNPTGRLSWPSAGRCSACRRLLQPPRPQRTTGTGSRH